VSAIFLHITEDFLEVLMVDCGPDYHVKLLKIVSKRGDAIEKTFLVPQRTF